MVWYGDPPMTSGCKVGVLIPDLLGTLCGCPWRCLWAAFWKWFPLPLCDVVGLVTEDHHSTQGFDLIVIFGSFCHTNWFWNQNSGTTLLQEKACCFCIVSIFLMYADIIFNYIWLNSVTLPWSCKPGMRDGLALRSLKTISTWHPISAWECWRRWAASHPSILVQWYNHVKHSVLQVKCKIAPTATQAWMTMICWVFAVRLGTISLVESQMEREPSNFHHAVSVYLTAHHHSSFEPTHWSGLLRECIRWYGRGMKGKIQQDSLELWRPKHPSKCKLNIPLHQSLNIPNNPRNRNC